MSQQDLAKISHELLIDYVKMLVPKVTHHIGPSTGVLDLLTFLYFDFLKIDPNKPEDPNRDIFILSKGHAGGALYPVLAKKGFFAKKELALYDLDGGMLAEHVSKVVPGIELSTGSLGHGLPVGVGMALAAKRDKIDKKVVVVVGDGELNEGSNWEATMFAGHHCLDNLIAIVDKNKFQGYSDTKQVIDLDPLKNKFESFGWAVREIDGHNFKDMRAKISPLRQKQTRPKVVLASTVKGKGVSFFEGEFISHYKSLDKTEIRQLLQELKEQQT